MHNPSKSTHYPSLDSEAWVLFTLVAGKDHSGLQATVEHELADGYYPLGYVLVCPDRTATFPATSALVGLTSKGWWTVIALCSAQSSKT
jgi:hypothetical protein